MKLAIGGAALLVAVGAVEAVVDAPPIIKPCALTDATFVILGGIALSIIAAVGKVIVDVQKGNLETAKVHKLVNGSRGDMLEEMAALKRLVSELSGRKDDRDRAVAAQGVADAHKEREASVAQDDPPA